jgi:hypothetical protein
MRQILRSAVAAATLLLATTGVTVAQTKTIESMDTCVTIWQKVDGSVGERLTFIKRSVGKSCKPESFESAALSMLFDGIRISMAMFYQNHLGAPPKLPEKRTAAVDYQQPFVDPDSQLLTHAPIIGAEHAAFDKFRNCNLGQSFAEPCPPAARSPNTNGMTSDNK